MVCCPDGRFEILDEGDFEVLQLFGKPLQKESAGNMTFTKHDDKVKQEVSRKRINWEVEYTRRAASPFPNQMADRKKEGGRKQRLEVDVEPDS